jgi:hypothetical protein
MAVTRVVVTDEIGPLDQAGKGVQIAIRGRPNKTQIVLRTLLLTQPLLTSRVWFFTPDNDSYQDYQDYRARWQAKALMIVALLVWRRRPELRHLFSTPTAVDNSGQPCVVGG